MVWVDFVIPAILIVSALFSVMRGFVREAISLFGWIAAFWIALHFANSLSEMFLSSISIPSIRIVIAFTILFVLTLLLAALINHLVGYLVKQTGLTSTDRLIGMIFGVARGGVIVSILVLLAGFTNIPQDPWWHESVLIKHFEHVANFLRDTVAPEIAGKME